MNLPLATSTAKSAFYTVGVCFHVCLLACLFVCVVYIWITCVVYCVVLCGVYMDNLYNLYIWIGVAYMEILCMLMGACREKLAIGYLRGKDCDLRVCACSCLSMCVIG